MPFESENGRTRLDRIETILEAIVTRHAQLESNQQTIFGDLQQVVRAQVLATEAGGKVTQAVETLAGTVDTLAGTVDSLTVRVDTLAGTVETLAGTVQTIAATVGRHESRWDELTGSLKALSDAQRSTQENLEALIAVVDGLIRRRPPPEQPN